MYDRINLMLPTYKRVFNGKLPKFLVSLFQTCYCDDNIYITFLVDEDDNETISFIRLLNLQCDIQVMMHNIKESHLGKLYNKIYYEGSYNDPNTLVSMVGDDMVFVTQNWDKRILDKANEINGVGIIFCDAIYAGLCRRLHR
jgi:hypothetical protein